MSNTGTSGSSRIADGSPTIVEAAEGDGMVLRLSGHWTTRTVAEVDSPMREFGRSAPQTNVTLDLSAIQRLDTAGAWLIERLLASRKAAGHPVTVQGGSEAMMTLLGAVGEASHTERPQRPRRPNLIVHLLEQLGRGTDSVWRDFLMATSILGATVRGGQMKLGRGHSINMAAIFNQIDRMGVGAIPVVVLMSTIVGAIVAQQGAYQLRYFGADIFVVDLVGILVLRELGVLMTAIMIAGRSGSAITAEIGSMKMREEVDALTVIGLNPVGVLVFPRLVALVIALPCLTIAANFAAIGGAIFVSWFYSDITPGAFIDRLRVSIDVSTIFAGLIKAPFMAMIIGIIGSVEGLKVGGSAESLGQHVTASVVKAIFVVVILDGLFAIFFAAIDF